MRPSPKTAQGGLKRESSSESEEKNLLVTGLQFHHAVQDQCECRKMKMDISHCASVHLFSSYEIQVFLVPDHKM